VPGPVLDEHGRRLGSHAGAWRFTPGQRRGLGIAAPEPLYALRVDAAANAVVVGPRRSLASSRVDVRGQLYLPVERAEAKLRYRSPAVPARVTATAGGFALELEEPAEAVAPGQVAALYAGDAVVGAGIVAGAEE
jgi:tRNA-specific 2-thiouridylase